jgi:hypothetical protein
MGDMTLCGSVWEDWDVGPLRKGILRTEVLGGAEGKGY